MSGPLNEARFNPPAANWLPPNVQLAETDSWLAGRADRVRRVKHNSKRTVSALSPAPDDSPTYYLKHDHPVNLRDQVKSLLSPKTRREYRALRCLHDLGLPVPEPVACAWSRSQGILVTRAIDGVPASDLWDAARHDTEKRRRFLEGLAELLSTLLAHNVWHPDMHLGNIVGADEDGATRLFLIDVYGAKVLRSLSPGKRSAMLQPAAWLHVDLEAGEREYFEGRLLAGAAPAEPTVGWQRLLLDNARRARRRWPKRRRKLLTDSGFCHCGRTPQGLWRWRTDFERTVAEAAVAEYRRIASGDREEMLKDGSKRGVARVAAEGADYVVKEFYRPGPWGRFSSDCRSWLHHWRLEMYGFPVPRCYAWLRSTEGRGYLVMEHFPGDLFGAVLLQRRGSPEQVQQLYQALVRLLRGLYGWRIVHEDLKTQNLIVTSADADDVRLGLIDNDAVLFDQRIGHRAYARNRRHLLGTLPPEADLVSAFEELFDREFGRG